jgi:putative oxidoreductase
MSSETMNYDTAAVRWELRALSVLRAMSGLLLLQHGTAKVLDFPYIEKMANVVPTSPGGIAGFLELFGGALLVMGLFTRPTAFVMSGLMAAAYFIGHAKRSFFPIVNEGELAVLYCFVFLFLAFAGGGPWSLDAWRRQSVDAWRRNR